MMTLEQQKYWLAFLNQKLTEKKAVMLRAVPRSHEHLKAVIAYDRARVEFKQNVKLVNIRQHGSQGGDVA